MNLLNKTLSLSGSLLKRSPFLLNHLINYKSDSLRIIYYHMVSKNKYPFYFDNKAISVDEFREQIIFFKKHYDIISLSDAIKIAKKGESLKRKLVITFDDGFTDNYTVAAPVLKDLKCNATFYLIGNCIDNKDLMWRNKLLLINQADEAIVKKGLEKVVKQYELNFSGFKNLMGWSFEAIPMKKKEEVVNNLWELTMDISIEEFLNKHKPYMTNQQVIELHNEGFEMGSHSMSHPNFSKLTYEEFRSEILNSKDKIEQLIHKKVNSFSYPFGQKSSLTFEKRLLKENTDSIETFLGTRNKLKNTRENIISWERDNLEHPFEIAMSRFLVVSALRSF